MDALTTLRYIIYGIITIILIIIITIIFIVIVTIIFSPGEQDEVASPETCIQTSDVTTLNYKGCYDAFSKNIFFEIKNDNLIQDGTKINFLFFDYNPRTQRFDVPRFNSSSYFKIPASRKPGSAEITLSSSPNKYCENPKIIPIEFCSSDLAGEKNVSISLFTETNISNFTTTSAGTIDLLPISLVDVDKTWESLCRSDWKCDSWQVCTDDLQKRECVDLSGCQIPTRVPQRVRSCNVTCVEDWMCEWSECSNGKSVPSCEDENKCGTSINKPSSVSCLKSCTPDVSCGEWSSCFASYDFLTLSGDDYSLGGKQTRTCTDKNSCATSGVEYRDCSLVIDIYTISFIKCDKNYIGIYNKLDNKLLANVEKSTNINQLNIDLSGDLGANYCDYCFDGILNGDEEQIDCGGSCASCETRIVDTEYSRNLFERILDAVFGFFG